MLNRFTMRPHAQRTAHFSSRAADWKVPQSSEVYPCPRLTPPASPGVKHATDPKTGEGPAWQLDTHVIFSLWWLKPELNLPWPYFPTTPLMIVLIPKCTHGTHRWPISRSVSRDLHCDTLTRVHLLLQSVANGNPGDLLFPVQRPIGVWALGRLLLTPAGRSGTYTKGAKLQARWGTALDADGRGFVQPELDTGAGPLKGSGYGWTPGWGGPSCYHVSRAPPRLQGASRWRYRDARLPWAERPHHEGDEPPGYGPRGDIPMPSEGKNIRRTLRTTGPVHLEALGLSAPGGSILASWAWPELAVSEHHISYGALPSPGQPAVYLRSGHPGPWRDGLTGLRRGASSACPGPGPRSGKNEAGTGSRGLLLF